MKRSLLCIFVLLLVPALGGAAERQKPADPWLARPVDDRTFRSYLDFFEYDRQLPFDPQVTKTENEEGLRREWFSFQSTSGMRVTALLTQPDSARSGKRPTIILLHGGGGQGKEGTAKFTQLFARAGWSV
ncbi:MAG TPA: hypothetical protein VFL80_10865, partial [Thermoanaerobaculia bacterium]|nr:hypothetical protein [Thermoanaerobaculia bacterium]